MAKKYFSMTLVLIAMLGLNACKQQFPDDSYADPFSHDTLYYNKSSKTLTFTAVYNSMAATMGTWHCIVHKDGTMASMAPFTTGVSPHQYFQALKTLGATDGENVTSANLSSEGTFTEGSVVEVKVTWKGAAKTYALSEIIEEKIPTASTVQNALGLEMRFGGNRANEATAAPPSNTTGCLMCFYSCAAGVTSNAKADRYILANKDSGAYRYFASNLAPADGTTVTITVTVK